MCRCLLQQNKTQHQHNKKDLHERKQFGSAIADFQGMQVWGKERMEGGRERMDGEDERVMGEHGRDELNDNGRLLLTFATDNRLAITNTFFSTRKDGIWHTYVQRCVGEGMLAHRLHPHPAGTPWPSVQRSSRSPAGTSSQGGLGS